MQSKLHFKKFAGTIKAAVAMLAFATLSACNPFSGQSAIGEGSIDPALVGVPSALVFSTQPSNAVPGAPISPVIIVTAVDAYGSTASTFSDPITLSIASNPAAGTLSGTVSQIPVGGVATFSDLSINNSGNGYTLQASGGTLPSVTSSTFNIALPVATQLAFSVQPSNTVAGSAISSIQVRALDSGFNLVSSFTGTVALAIQNNAGSPAGTLSGTTSVSAVGGVATFSGLSINRSGVGYTLSATTAGLTSATSSSFTITAGPATQLTFTTQPSNAAAAATISPAIQVTALDALGNVAGGYTSTVTLTISTNPPGDGALTGTVAKAAVAGVASYSNLSIQRPGVGYRIQASDGTLSVVSSTFDISVGAMTGLAYVVQPSSAASGAVLTPAIQVRAVDAAGNTVTSFTDPVTLSIANNPAAGTLAGTLTQSAASGVATFSDLAIDKSGTGYTLTAAAGTFSVTSTAFNISSGPATELVFTAQPQNSSAGAPLSSSVTVTARDANGNTATSYTSTITLAIGTNPPGDAVLSGTTSRAAIAGVATFSGLSIDKVGTGYTLAASDGTLNVTSASFNIANGTVASIAFLTQPSNAAVNSAISPSVQVRALDAGGNVVTSFTGSITIAIANNPSAGTLSGTLTQAANLGIATFNGLSINAAGVAYTLQATYSTMNATSSAFDIQSSSASQLAFSVQPSTTAAGVVINPSVVVVAQDSGGVTDTSYTGTVTIAIGTNAGSPPGTLAGTLSVSAVAGVATFSDLAIDKTGSGYTLTAASTGLTSATSSGFNITPGAATKLTFVSQPTNGRPNAVLSSVTVSALDAYDNVDTNYATAIALAFSAGFNPPTANLGGTTSVTPVAGIATFSSLQINKSGNGFKLDATSGSLTAATSNIFHVGIDLEVPIELLDIGISSSTTTTTWDRSRTSFSLAAYRDATYPALTTFSAGAVCTNTDSANHSLTLYDDLGSAAGSIQILAGTTVPTRFTGTFSPTAAGVNYRVATPATTSANQVQCFTVRLLVRQTYAYKTKIYIPLAGRGHSDQDATNSGTGQLALESTNSGAYGVQTNAQYFSIFTKTGAEYSGTYGNWTLEGVTQAGGGSARIKLYNRTTATEVANTEATGPGGVGIATISFADNLTGFTDGNSFDIRLKKQGGGPTTFAYLYKANLWLEITDNLQKATVPYRLGRQVSTNSTLAIPHQRVELNTSRFSNPSVRFQIVGNEPTTGTSDITLLTAGANESGTTGSAILGSNLNANSTTKVRLSTGPLSITSGDRYIPSINATSGTNQLTEATAWITAN